MSLVKERKKKETVGLLQQDNGRFIIYEILYSYFALGFSPKENYSNGLKQKREAKIARNDCATINELNLWINPGNQWGGRCHSQIALTLKSFPSSVQLNVFPQKIHTEDCCQSLLIPTKSTYYWAKWIPDLNQMIWVPGLRLHTEPSESLTSAESLDYLENYITLTQEPHQHLTYNNNASLKQ